MNMYNPLSATQRLEAAGLTRKQLEAALDKQTIKLSIITAAMLTLFCTIIGTLVAVLAVR